MSPIPLPDVNLLLVLPLIATVGTALAVLLIDVLVPKRSRELLPQVALAGLGLAFVFCLSLAGQEGVTSFSGMVRVSNLAMIGSAMTLLAAAGSIAMTMGHPREAQLADGEYYSLLLLSAAGGLTLCVSNEFMTMLLGIELLSLPLYTLAGVRTEDPRGNEAAYKYFLLGALSSALLVFGVAFIFGATGTTHFSHIAKAVTDGDVANGTWLGLGMLFLLAGFGFKLTLAPFHQYAPDVYQGTTVPVASFLATGSKAAGFVGLWNVLSCLMVAPIGEVHGGPAIVGSASLIVAILSLISMAAGNFGALTARHLTRLIAFSAVAHAGYISLAYLAGLTAAAESNPALVALGESSLAYYLIAYVVTNLLAFGVMARLGDSLRTLEDCKGLFQRHPLEAIALSVAMISLTGLPPTVGFFAKWQVILASVQAGYVMPAIVGLVLSILSAFYYLRVCVAMFFSSVDDHDDAHDAHATEAHDLVASVPIRGGRNVLTLLDAATLRALLGTAAVAVIVLGPIALYF